MAFAADSSFAKPAAFGGLFAALNKLTEAIQRRRVYRTTVNELSVLSDRDLSDLGVKPRVNSPFSTGRGKRAVKGNSKIRNSQGFLNPSGCACPPTSAAALMLKGCAAASSAPARVAARHKTPQVWPSPHHALSRFNRRLRPLQVAWLCCQIYMSSKLTLDLRRNFAFAGSRSARIQARLQRLTGACLLKL